MYITSNGKMLSFHDLSIWGHKKIQNVNSGFYVNYKNKKFEQHKHFYHYYNFCFQKWSYASPSDIISVKVSKDSLLLNLEICEQKLKALAFYCEWWKKLSLNLDTY